MFNEFFYVFVWKDEDILFQGVREVSGDIGIEEFKTEMFNYACDGYNVEFKIMRKEYGY